MKKRIKVAISIAAGAGIAAVAGYVGYKFGVKIGKNSLSDHILDYGTPEGDEILERILNEGYDIGMGAEDSWIINHVPEAAKLIADYICENPDVEPAMVPAGRINMNTGEVVFPALNFDRYGFFAYLGGDK